MHRSAELHRHVNPTFDDRPNVQVAVVKTDPPSSTRGAQPVTASATWVPVPASDSSPALRGEGMQDVRLRLMQAGALDLSPVELARAATEQVHPLTGQVLMRRDA